MKITDAITRIDELKHNTFSKGEKIAWLSQLDGSIKKLIIDTHAGGEDIPFAGYTEDTEDNTELLAAAPFDDIYLYWLEAQIDYYNGEFGKYNNSAARYNQRYEALADHYNRTHKPLPLKTAFFKGGLV